MNKIIKFSVLIGILGAIYYQIQEIKEIEEVKNKKIVKTNMEMEFQFRPRSADFYMKKKI